jgi:DNA-binding GntR family transcriptional regulator
MVDREAPRYPWQQVRDRIEARIDAGEFGTGGMLPSIRALAAEYQVAEVTVRKALRALREDGRIVTLASWGRFVREEPP